MRSLPVIAMIIRASRSNRARAMRSIAIERAMQEKTWVYVTECDRSRPGDIHKHREEVLHSLGARSAVDVLWQSVDGLVEMPCAPCLSSN
jgi:hypothetical protein